MKTEAKHSEHARYLNRVLTDPAQDPITYENINKLTQSLFDSWLMLGYRSGVRYGPKC